MGEKNIEYKHYDLSGMGYTYMYFKDSPIKPLNQSRVCLGDLTILWTQWYFVFYNLIPVL